MRDGYLQTMLDGYDMPSGHEKLLERSLRLMETDKAELRRRYETSLERSLMRAFDAYQRLRDMKNCETNSA